MLATREVRLNLESIIWNFKFRRNVGNYAREKCAYFAQFAVGYIVLCFPTDLFLNHWLYLIDCVSKCVCIYQGNVSFNTIKKFKK